MKASVAFGRLRRNVWELNGIRLDLQGRGTANLPILSVNKKLPLSKFRYFGKYLIQRDDYLCIHVSGQRRTGLEKNTSFTSPGTIVHVMHVLFVLFAVFENLIVSFS